VVLGTKPSTYRIERYTIEHFHDKIEADPEDYIRPEDL
jgi:hypothetical protein